MSEIYKKSNVRGIRGATTIESNKSELIKEATKELLEKMVQDNNISTEDIAAVFFTTTPDISDVKQMVNPVLRHRIIPNFNAEADGIYSDDILSKLLLVTS